MASEHDPDDQRDSVIFEQINADIEEGRPINPADVKHKPVCYCPDRTHG